MFILSKLRPKGYSTGLEAASRYLANSTTHFFDYNIEFLSHSQKRLFSTNDTTKNHHFIYGSKSRPQEDKKLKDHIVASFTSKSIVAMAEGQEKWVEEGVNPSEYPRAFCKNLAAYVKEDPTFYLSNPKELIRHTTGRTTEDGSCSVCVIALDSKEELMRASYLGNVGYAVLRRSDNFLEHLYQSSEQLRGVDIPYQVGKYADFPDSARDELTPVEHNDIIVVGSSTLFANLDENQLCACIRPFADSNSGDLLDAELVAEIISDTAFKFSNDREYVSPYQKKVAKLFHKHEGGKKGDIEVIVCQVKLK